MSTIIVEIERPAYGGLFIGRHKGKVVMIKGAVLPGETAEVVVENVKKDYLAARVGKVIKPAPHRIDPACRHFGACGGCQLQHIPYKLQIEIKEEVLRDCLRRLAKTEVGLSGPLFDDDPWNYRLRGQFKVSDRGLGFYREDTREVVDIDRCPLMDETINTTLAKIRSALKDIDVREIHITAGDCLNGFVRISSGAKSSPDTDKPASRLLDLGFSGLFIETPDKKISGYGRTHVSLNLSDMKYTVSPMTFFQSHWRLNRRVVEFIKSCLGSLKGKRVLDLYAGAGNFSIPFASADEVEAVEENPYAVEDGRRNLEINGIKNCRFIISSAENYRADGNFDIIILDPPRPGLTNRVLEKVLSLEPGKIVYISCNPATLARDLRKLRTKYDIESARIIDFFPQTFHIESLLFLSLR
ncbi:MAG: class I SAM-dependent RNA methyltransferase [Nitrospirae bacterium]|nr:class I SAM-dependent RNA methyltransferase [Nitrospirota bacterium]